LDLGQLILGDVKIPAIGSIWGDGDAAGLRGGIDGPDIDLTQS